MGKVCLYINRLSDIDIGMLEELVEGSLDHIKKASQSS
jgi:hypothetical protein